MNTTTPLSTILVRCPQALALAATLVAGAAMAYPIDSQFVIDSAQSTLQVKVSAFGDTDLDTNALAGTIDARFDFGSSGSLPTSAGVNITGADVSTDGDYHLSLGFPPFLGVTIDATDLGADFTTPAPPAPLTKIVGPGTVYQFDAANFLLSVNEGMVVVSGSANQSRDLSQSPIEGSAPVGTLGTISFTTGGVNGPFTRLDGVLNLPIQITETTNVSGFDVTTTASGTIRATTSFYVALSGIPGDFDLDGDADGADLARWRTGYGTGSAVIQGNADGDSDVDGNDFLIWQRNVGVTPPPIAATVPEPNAAALFCFALALAAARFRGAMLPIWL
jgi:hypothetical protein